VRATLAELGLQGPARVRDLWERRDLGPVDAEVAAVVPWHGSVLLRLAPRN
jgi:hypothetical protein